tara:strand:+ start:2827 stop:3648 length:822 start_codon:yes stop_codon:yes gene_type:complete
MAKLTKAQSAAQKHVETLLAQDILSVEDRAYVLTHYHEAAHNNVTPSGAFFTPLALAMEFAEYCSLPNRQGKVRILDLCAGIGALSFAMQQRFADSPFAESCDITCIEINGEYVQVGKKLVPEAHWLQMDICDIDALLALGQFDVVISNPPFGNVTTFKGKSGVCYTGSNAIYKAAELAAMLAPSATFIMPQKEAGFKYSGEDTFSTMPNDALAAFSAQTGIAFSPNNFSGTHLYEQQWKAKVPRVEFAECDFSEECVTASVTTAPVQSDLFG